MVVFLSYCEILERKPFPTPLIHTPLTWLQSRGLGGWAV